MAVVIGLALLAGLTVLTTHPEVAHAATSSSWSTDRSVAYQMDAAHDGALNHDSLTPPLIQKWIKTFPNNVSYPVIADGRVFVTVQGPSQVQGDSIWALDQATGNVLWGPVDTFASRPGAHLAYDQGRLYVLIYDGVLAAYDPATGTQLWRTQLGAHAAGFTAPPTAFGGMVFAVGFSPTGMLFAVDGASGGVAWSGRLVSGDHSSPAVTWNGVYVSLACNDATDWDPVLGNLIWHHAGCNANGGRTPALFNSWLYSRDPLGNAVLNAWTGDQIGTFNATLAPAFSGSTGYFVSVPNAFGPTLTAVDLTSGNTQWSFAGDRYLDTAPIVVNGVVYIGSQVAGLYALNAATGVPLPGSPYPVAGGFLSPDEVDTGVTLTGLGAGEGWLDAPAGPNLYAFTSALDVAPGDLVFGAQATNTSSAPATVNITNYGAGTATMSGFGTTGDFSQTNTCSSSLGPGASCSAAVTFTPTATGLRTGTLTFSDSATGAHTVALSGNAQSLFRPGPIRNLTAIPGVKSIRLSWLPPVYTGGSVTGYSITQSGSETTNVGPGTTTLLLSGLTVGATYSFAVTAHTTNGDSPVASASALVSLGFQDEIITQAGSIGTGPGTSVGQLPYAVAANSGHVYVGDLGSPVVRDVNLGSGQEGVLAGVDAYGYSGDGGPATSALVFGASAFAVCGGATYFADLGNYVIRKVDSLGRITTVAGDGQPGYTGDGGPATAAQLTRVLALACKSGGGLYIADSDSGTVRVLSPGGIISTLQPGFSFPTGLAEVSPGIVDVADAGQDNAVWQLGSGPNPVVVAGIPGSGGPNYNGDGQPATSATLSDPRGLLTIGSSLYIADAGNNRVRVVSGAGTISTFAGSGSFGFGGDGGQATSASLSQPDGIAADASRLYIADTGNNRVRVVDLLTHVITTIAGNGTASFSGDHGPATSAQLSNPGAIAFDSLGNEYVADASNNVVRKITTDGVISTFAGIGAPGSSPDGVPATSAALNFPIGLAVNSVGDVYISDSGNQRVRVVDHSTGLITTVAGNGSAGYNGDGAPATNYSLDAPRGLAVDSSGNVYIADPLNNRVRVLVPNANSIATFAGNGVAGYNGDGPRAQSELNLPTDVAVDAAGNVFIADTRNHRVREVDHSSGVMTTFAGNGVIGIGGDGGQANKAELAFPSAVAFDSAGDVFIADEFNRIRVVDGSGVISTVVGTCGIAPGFSGDGGVASTAQVDTPFALAFDAMGDLFVAGINENRVRETSSLVGFRGGACAGVPGATAGSRAATILGSSLDGPRFDTHGGVPATVPPLPGAPRWNPTNLKSTAAVTPPIIRTPAPPIPRAETRPALSAQSSPLSVAAPVRRELTAITSSDNAGALCWLLPLPGLVAAVVVLAALRIRRRT